MAPYIYLNLFVLIFSSKELFAPNYLNKILSIILSIILILFVGLRYKVGGDWVPYEIIYFDSQNYNFKDSLFKAQDYLFYLINYIIALTGFENGNVFLNLLISTFVFFSFYKYINFNKLNLISFIIFYPFMVIILMGFVRQSIALGFLFLILSNKLEKNIIKNIFYSIVAGQFHFSGYMLLIIPFLTIILKITNYKNIFYLSLIPIFAVLTISYFIPLFAYKFWVFETYINFSLGGLYKNFPLLICSFVFIAFVKYFYNSISNFYYYLLLSIFVIIIYFSIFFFGSLSDRILVYCLPICILTIAKLYDKIKSSYIKIIYFFSISIASFVFMIIWLFISNSSESWLPYNIYLIS